jgi:hypothetical protein
MHRLVFTVVVVIVALALPAAAHAAPKGFVGMTSEDAFGRAGPYAQAQFKAQRAAGVRLLRQTFDWAAIERERGGYEFTTQDNFVLGAARHGITVLPVLFNPPPFWAARARRGTAPPKDNSAMARFADAAVRRYGPGGTLWSEHPEAPKLPIRQWQVWNEPSLPVYWGGKPNAKAYVKLLKTVNDSIKSRDRGAEVVTAGIPPSVLRGAVPLNKFVKQMYKAGGKSAFDTLAVNSYARSAKELHSRLAGLRKVMNRAGDRRARIWITEIGWCDKGARHRFCVGTKKQSTLTKASLRQIKRDRGRMKLRGFVYFSWRDGKPYGPAFKNLWGLHTGLLKLNGKPKPALRSFKSVARSIR